MVYIFECYVDDNGCGTIFEIESTMSKAPALAPTCPKCHKKTSVARNYCLQRVIILDTSPKTLGALADKNSEHLSTDEKHAIITKNTAYKQQPFSGKLPDGASVVPRNISGQRVASQKQRLKDPKK